MSAVEMAEGVFLAPLLISTLQRLEQDVGLAPQTTERTYQEFLRTTYFEETHRQIVTVGRTDLNAHRRASVSWKFIDEWRSIRGFLEACIGNDVPACFQCLAKGVVPAVADEPDQFDDVPDPLRSLHRVIVSMRLSELEVVPKVENWESLSNARESAVVIEVRKALTELLGLFEAGEGNQIESGRVTLRDAAQRLREVGPVTRVRGLRIYASLPLSRVDALSAANLSVQRLSSHVSGYGGTLATRRGWVGLSLIP